MGISMPKIELHCHLDGSLTQVCLEKLLKRKIDLRELQVSPSCRDLAEYLEKFDLPLSCLQSVENLRCAGYDFMKQMAAEQMNYVEVRFAPLLSVREGLSCEQVIEAVLSGLEKGSREFQIPYGVIVCAMRHHAMQDNLNMIRAARAFLGNGVCAADLAGNEAAFPMHEFRELFAYVRRMEMPFTIHAGECGSAQNIMDAVSCGAKRIGHGIAMCGHPEVIEYCKKRHIGIEMCPTSNLQTQAVAHPSVYPMRAFLDAGLLVTLNTDNRTVSGTTLDKEMQFVQAYCKIAPDDLQQMMKNAVETAFADDQVKQELWKLF